MGNKKTEKTKVIRVFETFAGIGAQHKAISNIKKQTINKFEINKTSEWDARAIIAYSLIHHKYNVDKILKQNKLNNEEKINKYLLQRTFSLNSKNPSHLVRKPLPFKKRLVAACIVNNNNPDITKVQGEFIKDIDLITYSFPCQGLSVANMGRGQGIKQNAKSTSNLIWQIGRILQEAKENKQKLPKYLLMENVIALLGKKHTKDYEAWTNLLEKEFGYKTFTFKLIATDFGMVQTRKRAFAISILKPQKKWTKEIIEEILKGFEQHLTKKQAQKLIKKIIKLDPKDEAMMGEFEAAIPNNTKSRIKMIEQNKDLSREDIFKLNTLTTKQDRHPNIGMVPYPNNLNNKTKHRFITPREAYQIMGFDYKDFDKIKDEWLINKVLTKESLYRQAGNSIAVKVLEAIFKTIDEIEKREND